MNKEIYETDKFWYNQPSILLRGDRLLEFIPSAEMTFTEKLNAIVRFALYIGVALFIVKMNYLYLYIPLVMLAITFAFHSVTTQKESYQEEYHGKKGVSCQKPSYNNPFMNVMLTDYGKEKAPACTEKEDPFVKEQIEEKFNFNLYQNVDEIYGNLNSQRQYFTMPWTTIPNDQDTFTNWLYKSPKTLKEANICNDFGTNSCPEPNINGFRRRDEQHLNANIYVGYDPSV
jgi:hypothetical protein